jgi:oligoendopeptidase F
MEAVQYGSREEVPQEYRWNEESVFPSVEAWEAEAKALPETLAELDQVRGKLGEGPEKLRQALELIIELIKRAGRLYLYAYLKQAVNNTDPAAARLVGQAQGLFGRTLASISFLDPELLAVGKDTLDRWLESDPELSVYLHYVEDLFRKQEHVRSPEIEELLGMTSEPFLGVKTTRDIFVDGELKFEPARTSGGEEAPVSQGSLSELLASPDRELRRTAWEHYMDAHLAYKNTLAGNLLTSVKQAVFYARSRRYNSSLEAALFENNIPTSVVHNTVETFRRRLPTWHRYWKLRRKGLGLDELQPYDIWAPLARGGAVIPYQQAVEWTLAGIAPLGEEYGQAARKGLLEERWVDVYPTAGKSSAEFSFGWPGTYPFIVMNYDHTIFSVSTLVHELGHAMHSYLSWKNQPVVYAQYSIFAAEVASNFHQALVRSYLLENNPEREFQISVLEEALSNFHRYFFIMPILESFELEVHSRVVRGQGLSADDLNQLMADLFSEGYGSEVTYDRERVGITWATFSHLYQDFYVYQYTTGISGAHALAQRVLANEPEAVENYLKFLRAGSSMYPLEALRMAGIDLATPQPVEETFDLLDGMLDRLEELLQEQPQRG